jgi:hypothetical protein
LDAIFALLETDSNAIAVSQSYPKDESSGRGTLALSGYSILSKLSRVPSQGYEVALNTPCIDGALPVGEITEEDDIVSLLHVFDASSFGFALTENSKTRDYGGMVSLFDLLEMYSKDRLTSDLFVRDVASSPIFSMPRESAIKQAIHSMMLQKLRRVRVFGTRDMISDREILRFLFSKDRVETRRKDHMELIEGNLSEIKAFSPPQTSEDSNLRNTARVMLDNMRDCALTNNSIVTPWDLIMKPWRAGRLKIK